MSCFQSIPQEYRITDVIASGFPISHGATLSYMREISRTDFGKRLYDSRKAAKLTQSALAEKVGISQGTLAELEKIGQGSAYTPQLAKACGVSPDWLASGASDAAPAWPFDGIMTPQEWGALPSEARKNIRDGAAFIANPFLLKQRSGKLSGSSSMGNPRQAA